MNSKRIVHATAVLFGVLAGSSLAQQTSSPAPTIHVIGDAVSAVDAIEQLTPDFTRETGITVVIEKAGYAASLQKATADLQAKAGTYDLILQSRDALTSFATQGALFTINELEKAEGKKADFEGDLFPNAWHELSNYKGETYGYPSAANTMFVLYRKDLIDSATEKEAFRKRYGYELAPPQDWKQYRDLAEFFTRPAEGFYGTLLQGKRFPAVWFEWLNFAFSFGGGVMEKEHAWQYGPIIINSPETIQATDYYNSLKKFSYPGYANFTWDDAVGQMRQGHIFMCLMWSDALFHVVDPKVSSVVGKVGFAPLPAGKAGRVAEIAGSSYFVSRYSKNPGAAFEFILWMMRRDNQIKQELAKGASARKSVYDDTRVLELPYALANAQSLAVGRTMTDTVPEGPQIAETIETAVNDVLTDKKSSRQALDWAAVEINKLLGSKSPLKYRVSQCADLTC
jgi:multiple sugar transport system substrate-binding protein